MSLTSSARTAARFYVASGVEPGDRVAVWAPNTHHWVIAALGVHYAGGVLVPINTRYTGHEALDILRRTKAKVLMGTEPFLGVDRLAQLRDAAGPDGLPELRIRVSMNGAHRFIATHTRRSGRPSRPAAAFSCATRSTPRKGSVDISTFARVRRRMSRASCPV